MSDQPSRSMRLAEKIFAECGDRFGGHLILRTPDTLAVMADILDAEAPSVDAFAQRIAKIVSKRLHTLALDMPTEYANVLHSEAEAVREVVTGLAEFKEFTIEATNKQKEKE